MTAPLSDDFFVSLEDAEVSMLWGWEMTPEAWVSNPRRAELVALTDQPGLTRSLGALSLKPPEGVGSVVVGVVARDGAPAEVLLAQRDALARHVATLSPGLIPADVSVPPSLFLLARGGLCRAALVVGGRFEREPSFSWKGPSDAEWHEQGRESGTGAFGVRVGSAGPWRNPMVRRVDTSRLSDPELEAALQANGITPGCHLLHLWGN